MSEANLKFAKIVSTPTLNAWSQAYNAGGLFAVISLSRSSSAVEDTELGILGKNILESLEGEYFTLETKNLASIKQAITTTCQNIPNGISASLTISSIINNILYGFVFGKGKIFVRRNEKLGVVLSQAEDEKEIASSSGFLENNDLIILETKQFDGLVSSQELYDSLDHNGPQDIAENLSLKVHGHEEGGASAIVISYEKIVNPLLTNIESSIDSEKVIREEITEEQLEKGHPEETKVKHTFFEKFSFLKEKIIDILPLNKIIYAKNHFKQSRVKLGFNHTKKIFLTISTILLIVLIASVFFAIQKRENEKTKALFTQTFSEATQKYKEGESLLPLNQNLAKENLKEGEKILNENKSKFKKGSNEEKQILDLLAKIESALKASKGIFAVETKEVKLEDSLFLSSALQNSDADYLTQDEKNIYFVNNAGISSIDKKTKKVKLLIKKTWKDTGGVGIYLGNLYLLDKASNQIIKFINSGADFVKANYFASSTSPDLSKTTSMAIDGSIWVLSNDGTIKKFTKGKLDTLNISGLDEPLTSPSRIFTNTDANRFYVLDKGIGRIVVFNKDGSYQAQYQADILKDAKDFEVLEKDKKIYILSQNKLWQIDLK